MTKHLTCAETAKLLRQELKKNFPNTKFTVKSKTYSGGASIRIGWMDGPTGAAVRAVTHVFEGATFDGMTDMKSYKDAMTLNGEKVYSGTDYIFHEREISPELKNKIVDKLAVYFGFDLQAARKAIESNSAWNFPVTNSNEPFWMLDNQIRKTFEETTGE